MRIMATSFTRSHDALLHSLPPALQQATADPRLHRRLLDTPGKVWVSLLWGHCCFSWVLVHTRFCLCPPRVCFPVLCRFWWLYGGVNGDLLQEGLCHTHTQGPCPYGNPLLTCTPQETLERSSVSVSVGSLGPGAHKVCLSPPRVSGRYGV